MWAVENGNYSNIKQYVFDTQLTIMYYTISVLPFHKIKSTRKSTCRYKHCLKSYPNNSYLTWNWWWISNNQLNYLIDWITIACSNQLSLAYSFFSWIDHTIQHCAMSLNNLCIHLTIFNCCWIHFAFELLILK